MTTAYDAAVDCTEEVHDTDVEDDQDAVWHEYSLSCVEVVKSYNPNDRPVTVTDPPPVAGVFTYPTDARGASNESPTSWVPLTAATVTCAKA